MQYLPKVDSSPLIKNDTRKLRYDLRNNCIKKESDWRSRIRILGFKIVYIREKGWVTTDFSLVDRGESGDRYELNTDKQMISCLSKEVLSKIKLDTEEIEKSMKMIQDKFKIVQLYFYI